MKVYFTKLNKDAVIPTYAHPGDAGMDIRTIEDVELNPHETKIIHTGIAVALPVGYELQVRPRSGLSLKTPLRIPNAPGTIDSGYRDEIGVIMENISNEAFKISKGDRIAQLVLAKYAVIDFIETNDVKTIGDNRGGGFGHTGIK
jgi:dUTP pyrophosphatase